VISPVRVLISWKIVCWGRKKCLNSTTIAFAYKCNVISSQHAQLSQSVVSAHHKQASLMENLSPWEVIWYVRVHTIIVWSPITFFDLSLEHTLIVMDRIFNWAWFALVSKVFLMPTLIYNTNKSASNRDWPYVCTLCHFFIWLHPLLYALRLTTY
jgi:hypothetical protein